MEYCRFVKIRELQSSLEKKGRNMDGGGDEAALSRGVYDAYTELEFTVFTDGSVEHV